MSVATKEASKYAVLMTPASISGSPKRISSSGFAGILLPVIHLLQKSLRFLLVDKREAS